MATTAERSIPEPRRELLPAGVVQAAIWLVVVLCVVGPFFPLLYASVRATAMPRRREARL